LGCCCWETGDNLLLPKMLLLPVYITVSVGVHKNEKNKKSQKKGHQDAVNCLPLGRVCMGN